MSALRVARGFTGREKFIKFAGCYHGHSNELLVKAGSGLLNGSSPDSAGVTSGCAADTLVASYNDIDSVAELFKNNPDQIAAVILEPLPANMGVVLPQPGFLEGLRKICTDNGTLLIFDEVISGFRVALGGAEEVFGVSPDLLTFGKIIGGGMPVGAYGGRKDVMEVVAPVGPVYQAGTLSGNPVAMAAGIAQLSWLRDHPELYTHINELGNQLFNGLEQLIQEYDADCSINHQGSLGTLFFTKNTVNDFDSALQSDTNRFADYFAHMLDNKIYLAPSQFEAVFISAAHAKQDIDRTLDAAELYFKTTKEK
jgi:glutamate-1-semialdehyde 2,1-aminomutase